MCLSNDELNWLTYGVINMDADVVVVGGGIVGLWTFYHLTKQGIKSILFEQFPGLHSRGSSHGQSRITRHVYAEKEYAEMMPECFKMWKQLQDECGEEILLKMGVLKVFNMFKNEEVSAFYQTLDHMDRYAPSVDVISGEKIESQFPGLRFDSKHKAIYDENSGLLKADKCLEILREACCDHGGTICDSEQVIAISSLNSDKVQIKTCKKSYFARSVIVTCGAYTNRILSTCELSLPLRVMKAYVLYWRDKSSSGIYSLRSDFPAVTCTDFYSIPSYEYSDLLKICCMAILSFNAEDGMRFSAADSLMENTRINELKKLISERFPNIDVNDPVISEDCNFTRTPDWGFIIDYHPNCRNIVIGAGFSGHGFKTAPVVGKMLANMSQGRNTPYSREPFAIKRFSSAKL